MWAPDDTNNLSVELRVHQPGTRFSDLALVPPGGAVTSGQSYVLQILYSGTDYDARNHPYKRVILFDSETPTRASILADVTASVIVTDGLTKEWLAMFKMPNPNGTPSAYIALAGMSSEGLVASAIRGFATETKHRINNPA
jgi:hypothetical protein